MALNFPDIDPVAISLGPVDIRWYALAYVGGILLGWWLVNRLIARFQSSNPAFRPTREDIDDFIPWLILGVLLGGRIGYVLFYNPELYAGNPLQAFKIWEGGMSFHGGCAGVIVAMFLFAKLKKFSFWRLADLAAVVTPIGLCLGRVANFINGELFGRVTTSPLGMVFPHGGPEPRHPSQLYEAALEGAVLFVQLLVLYMVPSVRNRPGLISGLFLASYATYRFIIEFFREPDMQLGFLYGGATMGQLLCMPMFAAGAFIMIWAFNAGERKA